MVRRYDFRAGQPLPAARGRGALHEDPSWRPPHPTEVEQPADLLVERHPERLTREWEDLAERCGASPFQWPGWFSAWSAAFPGGDLELVSLRRGGRMAAALPVLRRGSSLGSPANWHTPVFAPVAESPADERELLERMFSLPVRSIDLFLLDGCAGRAAEAARAAGRSVVGRSVMRSPYIPLSDGWEAYERTLSKTRRKGIRRRLRRLRELGHLTVHVESGSEQLPALLAEAFAVEASGWKGRRGTAIRSQPETERFYTDLANWAAERGWLRLAFLRLNGRAVATELALEHGGTWYSLKAGYDEALRAEAPGVLLLYETLRRAFESGLERFELLGQADQFKLDWTKSYDERSWLRAFARSPGGRAEEAGVRGRELARALLKSPRRRGGRVDAGRPS